MGFLPKWRIHKSTGEHHIVDVSEKDGVRSMHLGSETVQSSMRISAPDDLELSYTRSMMGFLLFHPEPRHVLMLGLGGGSLAKFIYRKLSKTHTTVVELNQQVVTAARAYFMLPPDDARLSVEIAEGGAYVAAHPESHDVLIVDGFDGTTQPESLSTQTFYDNCAAALAGDGVLAVNLWGSDKRFSVYLDRINVSFNGRVLCLPAERRGNIIVLGLKKSPGEPRWSELREHAKKLHAAYGLDFIKFTEALKLMNVCTEKRLII